MPAGYKPRQTSSYGGRKKKVLRDTSDLRPEIVPMGVQDGVRADIKARTRGKNANMTEQGAS